MTSRGLPRDLAEWMEKQQPKERNMALERILRDIRKNEVVAEKKITKKILWTSKSGAWVVVEGPFPGGFSRTLTAKTITAAINRQAKDPEEGMQIRPGCATGYAKTLSRLVIASNEEWGEVCP